MLKHRKKKAFNDENGQNIGMVMTVSLFLIILTFFILLNSIAVKDERKTRIAIGSLLGAFGALPGGLSPMKTGESILPLSAPMIEEELNVSQLLSIMEASFPGEVRLEKIKSGQKIIFNEADLFSGNGFSINAKAVPLLRTLCGFLKTMDCLLEIVGHTDDVPAAEKGYHSNFERSSLMAIQLLKYFISEGEISAHRITAYGCASHKPVTSNDSRQSRLLNRRIEIILHDKPLAFVKKIFKKKPVKFFTYKKFDFKLF